MEDDIQWRGRLHQSYSGDLLRCPRKLHHRLLHGGKPATKPMEIGTIVHKLVLGGQTVLGVVDAKDWRTNAAKEERDTIREKGSVPVLKRELPDLEDKAQQIKDQLFESGFDLGKATCERTLLWDSSLGVPCEGTPDAQVVTGHSVVTLDLKVVSNADPAVWGRSFYDWSYDIQAAAYEEAAQFNNPGLGTEHWIAAVELGPPLIVTLMPVSEAYMTIGRHRWRKVQTIWAQCHRQGYWPQYDPQPIDPPDWLMARFENEEL